MSENTSPSVFARRFIGRALRDITVEQRKLLEEVAWIFKMSEGRFLTWSSACLLFDEDELANRRLKRACKYLGITPDELHKRAAQLQQKHQNQGMSPQECALPAEPEAPTLSSFRRDSDRTVYAFPRATLTH